MLVQMAHITSLNRSSNEVYGPRIKDYKGKICLSLENVNFGSLKSETNFRTKRQMHNVPLIVGMVHVKLGN